MVILNYSHRKAQHKAVPLRWRCMRLLSFPSQTSTSFVQTSVVADDALVVLSNCVMVRTVGPMYGYFPKPSKCILLAKPDRIELARNVFTGTGIDIQTDGSKDSEW